MAKDAEDQLFRRVFPDWAGMVVGGTKIETAGVEASALADITVRRAG